MPSEKLIKKYYLNKEELQLLGDYADCDCVFDNDDEIDAHDIPLPVPPTDNPKSQDIIEVISKLAIVGDPEEFLNFVHENMDLINLHSRIDESVKDVLELAYRYYISQGVGGCACDFGALYYSGLIFEQDYAKAKELYELAIDLGNVQALIYLGYIYEYGRVGKPDYNKAYELYARSSALTGDFEALYKMGDMYQKGKAVKKDMGAAVALWTRSYEASESLVEKCHAALRVAKIMISEDADECGLEFDPLMALNLFHEAEAGIRAEISNGAVHYKKHLKEAIEGQEQARKFLDEIDY